jgi:hypothetical protein
VAVGNQIDHPVLKYQHQLAAPAAEMRRRQHARARGRYQMGDAKGRAGQAGPLQLHPSSWMITGGSFCSLKPA